ncbi:MAG TPA: branched-chain amino acid ABC transporter permease [Methylomirabilota bacterium]|nr:branched-chain amino acid ABC transporter permease [Methylomirabilota bacterium]
MLVDFVQALVDGVTLGATYALLGLGFTLIFGVLRRLNLAFGSTILVGIYAGSHLWAAWGAARPGVLPGVFPAVLLATVGGAVLAGAYVERLSFRALAHQAPVVSMISSFAVSMQLQELVALTTPTRTMAYPAPAWLPAVALGPILLRSDAFLMWAGATALLLVLFGLLYRTRPGRAIRAMADSPETASLMGVNVPVMGALAFLVASAVGGVGGALIAASHQQVTPYFGLWATVKGLTAMLLGGAGSLPGAVVGGLLLGVVETESLWLLGGQFRDLAAYALLFLVAAVSPAPRRGTDDV